MSMTERQSFPFLNLGGAFWYGRQLWNTAIMEKMFCSPNIGIAGLRVLSVLLMDCSGAKVTQILNLLSFKCVGAN